MINRSTDILALSEARIESSRRIVKAMQKAISSDQGVEFMFDDGSQATIEPAIAKKALNNYNKMSPFERAQAAKQMRSSFKNFLQTVKGQ